MPPIHASSLRFVFAAATAAVIAFMVSATAAATGTGDTAEQSTQAPSKFYLRAGVSLNRSSDARFLDRNCSLTPPGPAALYGCGPGLDGAPLSSAGDFGTMTGIELGVGRVVSQFLRIEGTVQYRPNLSFDGHSNFTQDTRFTRRVSADASSVSALLAAYIDLAQFGLPRPGPLNPFIGGGVGLAQIDIDETRMGHPEARTTTIVPGGRTTNFGWMLAAGVAMPLGETTTLDVEWRYMDSGTVETGRDQGRVVWRDGSREPFLLDLAETRANLRSHGLHVSVRYAF